MNESAQVRAEIEGALDQLAQSVLLVKELEERIEGVTGTVLLIGLSENADSSIAGSLHLGQMAKQEADSVLNYLFELRQRLTLYRDKL